MLTDYLTSIVVPLLKFPESFHVTETQDAMGVLLTVDVASADMGVIIGREGDTAKALRTLLRVYGAQHQARVSLKINEPEGGKYKSEFRGETPPLKNLDDAINDL